MPDAIAASNILASGSFRDPDGKYGTGFYKSDSQNWQKPYPWGGEFPLEVPPLSSHAMRKPIIIAALLVIAGGAFALHRIRRADRHHYPERRAWMEEAIAAIRADLRDPAIHRTEDGKLLRPEEEIISSSGNWRTGSAIAFWDNSWMVYRQQTQKVDPMVHDIFIGRGSDGKWYYSDAHFCIGSIVMDMRGQPDSIEDFRRSFQLREFDGKSDVALESTSGR